MKLSWLFLCLGLSLAAHGQTDSLPAGFRMPGHPRILWKSADDPLIQQQISRPGPFQEVHRTILNASEKIITQPVLERQMTGRRLLGISW